jgi:hypothetical protein
MMKHLFRCTVLVCFCLSFAFTALSGEASLFNEEKPTVLKNGSDVYGQAFAKADGSGKLLVLAGDAAFMLDPGMSTVHDVAVNSINGTGGSVTIDYSIISEIAGAGLARTGDVGFAFTAKGNRYEVRLPGRGILEPI